MYSEICIVEGCDRLRDKKQICHKCNVSIGSFNDSIETLQSALNYLKKFK
jgi:hypothetical protein